MRRGIFIRAICSIVVVTHQRSFSPELYFRVRRLWRIAQQSEAAAAEFFFFSETELCGDNCSGRVLLSAEMCIFQRGN
jgi:hypothetical protein